jgi:hypothetical protein
MGMEPHQVQKCNTEQKEKSINIVLVALLRKLYYAVVDVVESKLNFL